MCFIPYENQGGSFWLEGNFVYTGVVIIANIKILNSTSNHTFFSFAIFFITLFSFIAALTFLDFLKDNDIYGTLTVQLISWEFYLGITFMSLAVVLVDVGLNYFTTRYRKHMIKLATTFKSVVTLSILWDRQHTFRSLAITKEAKEMHHGYAFSQEAGNAPLIMNGLKEKSW